MAAEIAALRDFGPAYDRFGSIASDQTRQQLRPMSALRRKRTTRQTSRYVRLVPKRTLSRLFDHLVGEQLKRIRNIQPNRSRRLEIDH
jgi:hypothetical protein